jgi:hypothetical protein
VGGKQQQIGDNEEDIRFGIYELRFRIKKIKE